MNTGPPEGEISENPPLVEKRPKSGAERLKGYRVRRKAAGEEDTTRRNRKAERKAWKRRKRAVDLGEIEAD